MQAIRLTNIIDKIFEVKFEQNQEYEIKNDDVREITIFATNLLNDDKQIKENLGLALRTAYILSSDADLKQALFDKVINIIKAKVLIFGDSNSHLELVQRCIHKEINLNRLDKEGDKDIVNPLFRLFGSNIWQENSFNIIPITAKNEMPMSEKDIIKSYSDEKGSSIPIVFQGAAKNWEAAAWTPEYFANHFGTEEIIITPQRPLEEAVGYDKNSELIVTNLAHTTIQDHIKNIALNSKSAGYFFAPLKHNVVKEDLEKDALSQGEKKNLVKNSIFVHTHLDLAKQTQFPQMVVKSDPKEFHSYFLFIGAGNTITSLHSHGSTFLSQIYGRKLATLIHPKFIERCSPTWQGGKFVSRCGVDIMKPDFEKFPELKSIEVHQTILEPGDVLYIPDGWLHDIRGLSTSISISSGF